MLIPVIMAGGSGTRLWPLSRTAYPKQFLALGYEHTMLQQAVARLDGLSSEKPIIITNEEHRFLVAEQLRQLGTTADMILEPFGRNTAPAIALAALHALAHNSSDTPPVLLILAADHVIQNTEAFQQAAEKLLPAVESGKFGTLGITPTEAATGYGYIKASDNAGGLLNVAEFVEKPDQATAQTYVDSKNYYWNSGMFMVRADRYLEELQKFNAAMFNACKSAIAQPKKDLDFIRIDKNAFEQCPDDSIDYAVMEPLTQQTGEPQVVVSPLDAGWSDVGSWSALWEVAEKTDNGNAILHNGSETPKTILQDTKNCLVSTSDRLVSTLGLEDIIVVDTKDAVLVAHKDKVQNVKNIVATVKQQNGSEHQFHREVYRPWGKYDSIDHGERYQVKRITVKPGAKLSVQMHHHRAEHWIVVCGTAKVFKGEESYLLGEDESTYIPIGTIHALENPGKVDLEIIEVQSGSYLGEDDIIRFEDKYGRS
jgi:mannose-1-phosphate guanylyltransferase